MMSPWMLAMLRGGGVVGGVEADILRVESDIMGRDGKLNDLAGVESLFISVRGNDGRSIRDTVLRLFLHFLKQ
jgi:hypothetical protein